MLAVVCKSEARVLVTLDLDFADIRAYPPAEYSGFVVLRPASHSKPRVERLLKLVISRLASEDLSGKLWVVDDAGIRIRHGE